MKHTVSVSWILMSYAGGWRPRFLSAFFLGGLEWMEGENYVHLVWEEDAYQACESLLEELRWGAVPV